MKRRIRAAISLLTGMLWLAPGYANSVPPEEEEDQVIRQQSVVVTGSYIRVTQGGAQDIRFFRDTVADGEMPAPGAITSEGLLSEHDLLLATTGRCDQLFCLNAEAMDADLVSYPEADYLLGLGFDTNLTYDSWERDPLTIIAVVDNSGSMNGDPLDIARASMKEVLANLRPGDRMGVIKYGSTTEVVMPVSDVETSRNDIITAIDGIYSNGSTKMEAGLRLGFDTAFNSQSGFDGTTRVILFTDEQPNVGDTDAEGFIGMARAAAERHVGLTTVGVADHFGAELANQVSAAQGGNLFYVPTRADIVPVFGKDFDLLVTELARNLKMRIEPAAGMKIEHVFGVPGETLEYHYSGGVSLEIPSVFLSSNGGGIFMTLSGEPSSDAGLADISLSYVESKSRNQGEDRLQATLPAAELSEGLQLASLLVDEFGILQSAAETSMFGLGQEDTLLLAERFAERLEAFPVVLPEKEHQLLSDVTGIMRNNGPRFAHQEGSVEEPRLNGAWKITGIRDRQYSPVGPMRINLEKGDYIALDLLEDMFNARRFSPRRGDPEFEVESLWVDTDNRQITLYESDLIFNYRVDGDKLYLTPENTDLRITLQRMSVYTAS